MTYVEHSVTDWSIGNKLLRRDAHVPIAELVVHNLATRLRSTTIGTTSAGFHLTLHFDTHVVPCNMLFKMEQTYHCNTCVSL